MPTAYYRCEVKTISRGKGHAATAAAAYRSGSKLQDTRTGLTHDYRRKSGIEHSEILTPTGTTWIESRDQLWNAAEQVETRGNARVAREVVVCFPHQLDKTERIKATQEFGHWLAKEYGVAVDLNLHRPERRNDSRNYHAHVLFTTRELTADGFGKKTRQLDDRKQGPKEVERIRQAWASSINRSLQRSGLQERVDHRSNKEQGIDTLPQVHLGRAVIEMEKRGISTAQGDRFRQIQSANDNISRIRAQLEQLAKELRLEQQREQARQQQQNRRLHRRRRAGKTHRLRRPRGRERYQHTVKRQSRPVRLKLRGEAREATLTTFARLYLNRLDQHPGQAGAAVLDWKTCKDMALQGFTPAAIKVALRETSPYLPQRRLGWVDKYVEQTVQAVFNSQQVQLHQQQQDQRALLAQFRRYLDRERIKPHLGAARLRQHERRLRTLLNRAVIIGRKPHGGDKPMLHLLGRAAAALSATRVARKVAEAIQKSPKPSPAKETAKTSIQKAGKEQGKDPVNPVTPRQRPGINPQRQQAEKVTAEVLKTGQFGKQEPVTPMPPGAPASRPPMSGGGVKEPNQALHQQGLQEARVLSAQQRLDTTQQHRQDPASDASGLEQQVRQRGRQAEKVAEQVQKDKIPPEQLNARQQYSVLLKNEHNRLGDSAYSQKTDVEIAAHMLQIEQFKAQEGRNMGKDAHARINPTISQHSPQAARYPEHKRDGYADRVVKEALVQQQQNERPERTPYKVFAVKRQDEVLETKQQPTPPHQTQEMMHMMQIRDVEMGD